MPPDRTTDRDTVWDVLFESITHGRIIPILGSEILEINDNGVRIPFYQWVAMRLAEDNHIPKDDLPPNPTLNDVVCRMTYEDRWRVHSTIKRIVDKARPEPPEILKKLAEIDAINLFVVLTFDQFMVSALNSVRGTSRTIEKAYPEDIPSVKIKDISPPIVYHLFGKLTNNVGGYVVSDEDMLEKLYEIQSSTNRPNNIFDALANNNLLFVGCNFSDWLSRFLIRTAKGKCLSVKGDSEIFVDSIALKDTNLVVFLQKFSPRTYIMPDTVDSFINELARRWRERIPQERRARENEMADNAIFISYCREDIDAATEIATTLNEHGFDVWIDRRNIDAGDKFTDLIQRNIGKCSCFLPIISNNTLSQNEAYFYKEWNWAAERAEGFAPNTRFIVPVIIDDTDVYSTRIPRYISDLHLHKIRNGIITDDFIDVIRRTVRDNIKRKRHG